MHTLLDTSFSNYWRLNRERKSCGQAEKRNITYKGEKRGILVDFQPFCDIFIILNINLISEIYSKVRKL